MNKIIISIIICAILPTSVWAQKDVDSIINLYKSKQYLKHKSFNATDSLIKRLDFEKIYLMLSNQFNTKCPEFGVYGTNYNRLLVHSENIEKDKEKGRFKLKIQVDISNSKIDDILNIEIDSILLQKQTQYYSLIEVFSKFSAEKIDLKGYNRVVTRLTSEGKILDKLYFPEEEGFRKEWIGKIFINENNRFEIIGWGFSRFPERYFTDFDIGNGELLVNYKYLENGWSNSFSLKDFIYKQAENVPMSDYKYLNVSSLDEIIEKWEEIEKKVDLSFYGYTLDQINLGCK